ncbi:hypothetical protein PR202_ga27635 [Eleusine coracana subsp. coracana]|uniref:Uncharacterized protein n=1 Tax=Eleusine coracana subsp. coracana TaxID=191504 RepID=A0AAV5DF17_ELECO|nr:hypothetical protein PR202_ga27635 [Eleusine coracana subsp. coracana]
MPPETMTRTTMFTYRTETEQGKHVFEIFDYSQHKGMDTKKFIRFDTFSVGGHDWAIRFYPDGFTSHCKGYISVYVELLDKETKSEFEASNYLRDDHLTIQCVVTVKKKSQVLITKSLNQIEVPPSNIAEQLGNLLHAKEGTDVTFSVAGARSPVFRAELYGSVREAKSEHITIEDMQPAVFKALMHFIYTEVLPETGDQRDANLEMIQHLLVAADRYAVDRLKLVCQSILCKTLDVENVCSTMALAYHHNCDRLKDICLDFITRSDVMDALVKTADCKNLKRTCPSALADAFEKMISFCKM